MADWSLPTLGSNIMTTFLSEVKNRDTDLALQFDGTSSTSIPTGAIRWTSSANTWQRWTGSAWGALSSTFAFPAVTVSGNVSAAAFIPTGSTVPANGVYLPAANSVAISANSFGRLLVNETGVGVGISSPGQSIGARLHIRDGSNVNLYGAANGAAFQWTAINDLASAYIDYIQNALTIQLQTGGSERVRINSSGNIGCGTSNPQARLHVVGNVNNAIFSGGGYEYQGIVVQSTYGNASTNTVNFIDFWNENNIPLGSIFNIVKTDGGSDLAFRVTPAGSRTADRRVEAFRLTSTGAISLGSSGSNTGTIGQAQISQGASAPPTWGFVAFADVASKPTTLAGYGITDAQPKLASGASVASTSGTAIDFTGIPSWVKRITVMFNGVSTNGTSNLLIQVGAGSVANTGYTSQAGNRGGEASATNGFLATNSIAAISSIGGNYVLTLLGSNTWTGSGVFNGGTGIPNIAAGSFTLSGTLDRVRITTANGTDAFDAGTINILYE